jgi:hypothetical protein
MHLLNKPIIMIVLVILSIYSKAQIHYNAWFRGTLSYPLSEKVKVEIEFQHRRQNGYENKLMFDKNLMYSFRSWLHYQYNENVKLSLSPLAYFSNYKIIQQKVNESEAPNHEIRFSGTIEMQQRIFQQLYLVDRTAMEYRFFENTTNIVRFRNRIGLEYVLNKKMRFGIYDELFLNLRGTSTGHFFDHDRIGSYFEYKITSSFKIGISYIHISRLPLTSEDRLYENNLLIHAAYLLRYRK